MFDWLAANIGSVIVGLAVLCIVAAVLFKIVRDKKRGKGYGRQMVCLAVQYAFDVLNVQKVSLGVFENNAPAIGCYRACGFGEVRLEQTEQYSCLGQVWKCIEMQRQR